MPTAKELGLNISYVNMRAVVGAAELSPAHQAWHINLMKQVYETQDWQDFVRQNALEPKFLTGNDFQKFLDDFEKLHRDIMTQAGWI